MNPPTEGKGVPALGNTAAGSSTYLPTPDPQPSHDAMTAPLARVRDARKRLEANRARRTELQAARTAGLRIRHASKIARTERTTTVTNTPDTIRDVLAGIERDRAAAQAEWAKPPTRVTMPDGTVIDDHTARWEAFDRILDCTDRLIRALGLDDPMDSGTDGPTP